MTTQALTINFHGTNLFIIDQDGQPFTPMKTIVEGMGLGWQAQYDKLTANSERWGIRKILIPTIGNMQEAICLPLRKLSGWLATIHPNKVKADLRDTIIYYQNECDDVLWNHWTKEHVQYGLKQLPEPPTITKPQQGILFNKVANIAAGRGQIRSQIWSRFQNHFKLSSYKDLSTDKFDEALAYLDAKNNEYNNGLEMLYVSSIELAALVDERVKAIEGELLPKQDCNLNSTNSISINLAPLIDKKSKRWLITQSCDEMVVMMSIDDDKEVMTKERFIMELRHDNYMVVKKDELNIGNMVLEHIPARLLPIMIETAGRRLNSIEAGRLQA